jgi:Flp pilus assembly protein TadD
MVVATALPEIDRAVAEVEGLVANARRRVVVQGPATAGKSTVLSRVVERARNAKRPVIALGLRRGVEGHLDAPRFGVCDDAGVVLLASAAAQLREVDPKPYELLQGKRPYAEVRDELARALGHSKPLVVVDDVLSGVGDPAFGSFFVERTHEALATLLNADVPRVFTADRPGMMADRVVEVRGVARASEMLAPSQWNGLGHSAERLARSVDEAALSSLTPLELRLCVALTSLGAAPKQLIDWSARDLVRELFERLSDGSRARTVLARLSLCRVAIDEALLEACGFNVLDERTRALLRHGVLFEEAGSLRLHETFAREAATFGWLTGPERKAAHHALAQHHLVAFETATSARSLTPALEHELEAFHHFVQARDASAIDKATAHFAEQLDALGKALSEEEDYGGAVRAYERAIERDPNDWYAHHYLAYNLDVPGKDAPRVEAEYRKALDLHPQHVWLHGRLATFYVTRGRLRDAESVYRKALRQLERQHVDDARLYLELHRPLARLLLHRGELDMAHKVLSAVPRRLRSQPDSVWPALDELWERLDEAEREAAVFPPLGEVGDARWAAPHLVRAEDHGQVAEWMPGCVTHVEEGALTIRVAPQPGQLGWLDVPAGAADWRGSDRAKAAGTFVEVVRWKDGRREILVHPPVTADRRLPGLFPAPDRYLR